MVHRFDGLMADFLLRQNLTDPRLSDALKYVLLGGGKRVRPQLVWAACEAVGGTPTAADAAALAVECIHGYSLVHDDLPCMDDDDLRRGRPTCHRQFDEATALLVGDSLQALAFVALTESTLPAADLVTQTRTLARAAHDMVVGQRLDLAAEGQTIHITQLETIHRLKTGALIRASVQLGAVAGGARPDQLAALDAFAAAVGLAFQVHDDVLDVTGTTATLGKQAGADAQLGKATYPALMGLDAAQAFARQLSDDAHQALSPLGASAAPLQTLAAALLTRSY